MQAAVSHLAIPHFCFYHTLGLQKLLRVSSSASLCTNDASHDVSPTNASLMSSMCNLPLKFIND